jgi:hypothetical protein
MYFTLAVPEMAPNDLLSPVTRPQALRPQPAPTERPQPKRAMIQRSVVDMERER